jgi:hypothetical protein
MYLVSSVIRRRPDSNVICQRQRHRNDNVIATSTSSQRKRLSEFIATSTSSQRKRQRNVNVIASSTSSQRQHHRNVNVIATSTSSQRQRQRNVNVIATSTSSQRQRHRNVIAHQRFSELSYMALYGESFPSQTWCRCIQCRSSRVVVLGLTRLQGCELRYL